MNALPTHEAPALMKTADGFLNAFVFKIGKIIDFKKKNEKTLTVRYEHPNFIRSILLKD